MAALIGHTHLGLYIHRRRPHRQSHGAEDYGPSGAQGRHIAGCGRIFHQMVLEVAEELLFKDRDACTTPIKAIDDRNFRKDPVIGYMTILVAPLWMQVWMSAEWKPLATFQPPISTACTSRWLWT
jgi:hypothetical protein